MDPGDYPKSREESAAVIIIIIHNLKYNCTIEINLYAETIKLDPECMQLVTFTHRLHDTLYLAVQSS